AGRGDEPHRPRAWLGADLAGAFRSGARAERRAVRRRSRTGGGKDRRPAQDLRQRPLPVADGDRHHAACQGHEGDRALRHQGGAGRAQGNGEGRAGARRLRTPARQDAPSPPAKEPWRRRVRFPRRSRGNG
ncbi:hypothetical protein, partial [Mesorhizobium sp.]|uniref:hypothetical protein n=1 Tax=Mesorhizobium sp. TaxID=1871066 RepID=UPI0034271536